jgi:DNA-binding transcriptional LysR family regulator
MEGAMDASDLRVFEAVARLGGMNRAAAELNTVQSNVTARIRQLEASLNATLFERHSRGVSLTAAGRRLLPHALQVGQALEEARRAVCGDGAPGGTLVVGSLETTAALRLSPVLASYAAAYPAVDLVLRTGTTAEMVNAVLARTVEGAFVCGPVDHPALAAQFAFREEMVVATHPSIASLEALARQDGVKIVVLRAGCSYRQRFEDILARRGIVGLRLLEFGTLDSIVGCVAAGIGATLLPRSVLAAAERDGRVALHALPRAESAAETLFIRRRDGVVSAALAAFLDHVVPPAALNAAE